MSFSFGEYIAEWKCADGDLYGERASLECGAGLAIAAGVIKGAAADGAGAAGV